MSTSIVRIYTPEGFVVGADRRKYNLETKTVLSDSVQKIFSIEQPGRRLAYALSGTVELTPKGSTEVIFDFVAEIDKAVQVLASDRLRSLWHYAHALSEALTELPEHAKQALSGDDPPTVIYLDGYYDGRPKRAHVQLFYDGQVPEVSVDPLDPGASLGCGSPEVVRLLTDSGDNVLAKYRTPSLRVNYESRTLADAIEIAKSWMSAHRGPEAVDIDPLCAAIGGQPLICTLTASDGFRWLPEFGLR